MTRVDQSWPELTRVDHRWLEWTRDYTGDQSGPEVTRGDQNWPELTGVDHRWLEWIRVDGSWRELTGVDGSWREFAAIADSCRNPTVGDWLTGDYLNFLFNVDSLALMQFGTSFPCLYSLSWLSFNPVYHLWPRWSPLTTTAYRSRSLSTLWPMSIPGFLWLDAIDAMAPLSYWLPSPILTHWLHDVRWPLSLTFVAHDSHWLSLTCMSSVDLTFFEPYEWHSREGREGCRETKGKGRRSTWLWLLIHSRSSHL